TNNRAGCNGKGIIAEGVRDVIHTLALAAGLLLLWFLSSGYFLPLILGLGAGSIVAVLWLAHRMDVVDHESHPIHMAFKGLLYFPWLALEVLKSNLDICLAVLKGDAAIAPATLKVKASQASDVGRVTYANSITLTPGTVTLFVDGDTFLVHALTESSAAGLATGDMDRRVTAFEGRVASGTEGVG
ncbi:MAG: Na+/H+ antiporter subunit E, partial [Rhodospirillaceae bacterium]